MITKMKHFLPLNEMYTTIRVDHSGLSLTQIDSALTNICAKTIVIFSFLVTLNFDL